MPLCKHVTACRSSTGDYFSRSNWRQLQSTVSASPPSPSGPFSVAWADAQGYYMGAANYLSTVLMPPNTSDICGAFCSVSLPTFGMVLFMSFSSSGERRATCQEFTVSVLSWLMTLNTPLYGYLKFIFLLLQECTQGLVCFPMGCHWGFWSF